MKLAPKLCLMATVLATVSACSQADSTKTEEAEVDAPKTTETNGLITLTKSHPKWKTIKGWITDNKQLTFEKVMTQLELRCTKESLYSKAMSTEIDKLISANKKQ